MASDDRFDPVDPEYLRRFGIHLRRAINMLEYMTFYGGSFTKKEIKSMKNGRAEAREIAKMAMKGKGKKIFKDPDEYNLLP